MERQFIPALVKEQNIFVALEARVYSPEVNILESIKIKNTLYTLTQLFILNLSISSYYYYYYVYTGCI